MFVTNVEIGLWTIDHVRDYDHSLNDRLNQRFHDRQTDYVFKGIKLLDTCLWLKDKDSLIVLGKEEPSSVGKKIYQQWERRAINSGKEELSSVGKKSYQQWKTRAIINGKEELSSVEKKSYQQWERRSINSWKEKLSTVGKKSHHQ